MKKFIKIILYSLTIAYLFSGCMTRNSKTEEIEAEDTSDLITIGFSQLGAESDWRCANTKSMENTFTEENGYELVIDNAQQKQTNQITAIRTFIQQGVDYIVLAPVTESGWDTVLEEAKEAGIPVIIVDRQVDVADENLYTCWVGSDFMLEGRKVTSWLKDYIDKKRIDGNQVNIVNIQGTLGASSQIGRSKALEEACREYGWRLLKEVPADYTQTKAKEVMRDLLNEYDNINVVYCENDNEAAGAIEALKEAGLKCGSDIKNGEIMVLSFDGVWETAMNYCLDGTISCIAECNPLHGPRVAAIIEQLKKGETPDKYWYVEESIYTTDNTVTSLTIDDKEYPITMLTEEYMYDRAY